jgi:Xaa-Pro aminopeptidase
MLQRCERFRQALDARGLDGAVVRRPANVQYLSGVLDRPDYPTFAVVGRTRVALVRPGSSAGAQDGMDLGIAIIGYAVPGATVDRVADVGRLSADALATALEHAGLAGAKIGIEEAALCVLHAGIVARYGDTAPIDGAVEALRRIKDGRELAAIRAAVRCNEVGLEAARCAIAAGVSEFDVQDAVVRAMQDAAGVPIDVTDDTNCFISGSRTQYAAGPTTSRKLEPGDLMIVDLNPFIHSYKGDTTRTFSVGSATAEHHRVHDVLVRSLEAAEARARPGVAARDVYAALAETIARAGYGPAFTGHGGHGIGLEHLERPFIIPAEDMLLAEGMVLSLEPGVYHPSLGGLRIEDNYLVTAGGLEALSRYPRTLVCCG